MTFVVLQPLNWQQQWFRQSLDCASTMDSVGSFFGQSQQDISRGGVSVWNHPIAGAEGFDSIRFEQLLFIF